VSKPKTVLDSLTLLRNDAAEKQMLDLACVYGQSTQRLLEAARWKDRPARSTELGGDEVA